MPRGIKAEPPCETLSAAAAKVLRMKRSEFLRFEPKTTAETAAHNLAVEMLRGDVHAFTALYRAADRGELMDTIRETEDALSRSLEELAATL